MAVKLPLTTLLLAVAVLFHAGNCLPESDGKSSSSSSHIIGILVVANGVVLVVMLFLLIIYYRKYTQLKKATYVAPREIEHDSTILSRAAAPTEAAAGVLKGKLVFMDKTDPKLKFELDDLFRSSAEGLGRGNFGNCYKAMLEIGQAIVVKRLIDLKPLSSEEFVRQVKAIAEHKHPNLLPLLAYYHSKDEEKLFLYRFAPHGNLFNRLHGGRGTTERVAFTWRARVAVARGVARALEYLHRYARAPHGNLKSSNVLLGEEDEEVLVCDYGLTSLVALPIAAQRMVAFKTPEYQSQKMISKKSDVWSYGCLVLELLTGRIPAHSAAAGTNGVDLCGWVNRAVREEWTAEIFDPEIVVNRCANQGMLRLMQIAIKCCENSPDKRPDMALVLEEVEKLNVGVDSEEDEFSHDSYSASSSLVIVDAQR